MSTSPPAAQPGPTPQLEVVVRHPRDVPGATEGGADRLLLVDDPAAGGRSPEPATVSSVCKETDVPVRVLLRLNGGTSTTGGELARLVGLGHDYLGAGAEGVAFGFLDHQLGLDTEVCGYLADQLPGTPWTFHRVFDEALETDRAWRDALRLPGLDTVLSAGSVRGLAAGHEELIDRATADAAVARLVSAAGGLEPGHVPWLVRAGVRRFQVAASVRPGGTWSTAYADAGLVRSWRLLVDDAAAAADRTGTAG